MRNEKPLTKNKKTLQEFIGKITHDAGDYIELKVTTNRGVSLFTCQGTSTHNAVRITSTNDFDTQKVVLSAMISGIVHIQITLTSGNTNRTTLDETCTTHDTSGFATWFSKMTEGRILVPDTNAIIDRYLSSLRFTIGDELVKKLMIRFPRLSVLEMERIANKSKSGSRKEKRNKILSSAAEIQFLKQNGAIFLPELNKEIFEAFSRIAKDQVTDSWIRREIHEQIPRETIGIDSDKVKKVTLFTADLINALSATSEGIDTLFVSKVHYDETSTRSSNLEQITQLVVMATILYGEVRVSINNRRFAFKGNWEGKTPLEWLDDSTWLLELKPQKSRERKKQ